jgi:hypothetical protein
VGTGGRHSRPAGGHRQQLHRIHVGGLPSARAFGKATAITAVPAGGATRPSTALSGVSCPRAGPCVATGVATSKAGHYLAMYATMEKGRWVAAFLTGPADVSRGKGQQSSLFSVSCAASGPCSAVGYYNDASGGYRAAAAALGSR